MVSFPQRRDAGGPAALHAAAGWSRSPAWTASPGWGEEEQRAPHEHPVDDPGAGRLPGVRADGPEAGGAVHAACPRLEASIEAAVRDGRLDDRGPKMDSDEGRFELKVVDVVEETDDARSIVFEVPDDAAEEFDYKPGQFLTVAVPSEQTGIARAATRCQRPHERTADDHGQADRRGLRLQLDLRQPPAGRHAAGAAARAGSSPRPTSTPTCCSSPAAAASPR